MSFCYKVLKFNAVKFLIFSYVIFKKKFFSIPMSYKENLLCSVTHLEPIFIYGMNWGSNFVFYINSHLAQTIY